MLCDISEPMLGRLFLQIWNACCSSKPKGTTDTEWELLSVSILRCYLDESDWQAYGLPEFTESLIGDPFCGVTVKHLPQVFRWILTSCPVLPGSASDPMRLWPGEKTCLLKMAEWISCQWFWDVWMNYKWMVWFGLYLTDDSCTPIHTSSTIDLCVRAPAC